MRLAFRPLTPERWADLEALFGPDKGANSGCWCMWWRLTRSVWDDMGKARRKAAFRRIVRSSEVPGLLAYGDGRAVGWCAIAPRRASPSLERSRVTAAVDRASVWSITCFYIDPAFRRRGLMRRLIEAATDHARRSGARIVEAYPHEPRRRTGSGEVFTGLASTFRTCGFVEVARRSPTRPLMRRTLDAQAAPSRSSRRATRA